MSNFIKKASTPKVNTIVIVIFVLIVLLSMMKLVENSPKRIQQFKGEKQEQVEKIIPLPKTSLAGKEPLGTEKMLSTFYITVAILFILVLLLRWYKRKMVLSGHGTESNIKIKDRHYLGPKQSLIVVTVDDRELLLGMTDHQISFLADLSKYSPSKTQKGNFDTILENVEKKISG